MKILGLDIGSRRIGVAISDALEMIAQGLLVIDRVKEKDIFGRLKSIAETEEIKEIVVGLPLNMNGTHGPKAKESADFANILKEKLKLPVTLWDERMSTVQVERVMIEGGASRSKRKEKIDKLAAQVILQSYLNRQKDEHV